MKCKTAVAMAVLMAAFETRAGIAEKHRPGNEYG
jgi:hypothetical protein